MQHELFTVQQPTAPQTASGIATELRESLRALAEQKIFFGTSSWKYKEWEGTVYNRAYKSKAEFEKKCLEEYAEIFPMVGGDFSFYNWPSDGMLAAVAEQTPPHFEILLKCTDVITMARFPNIARWKEHAGMPNQDFLNAKLFLEKFLEPTARTLGTRLGPIILEFTTFPAGFFVHERELIEKLQTFIDEVGKARVTPKPRFCVELRNREFATPSFYAQMLEVGAVPIMSSWTRMPPMDEQWKRFLAAAAAAPFLVGRPVLRPGKLKDDAEREFAPFTRIRERVEPMRLAIQEMSTFARQHDIPAYFSISNTIEGCAFETIREEALRLTTASEF